MMQILKRACVILVLAALAACGGRPLPEQFVGKWKSNRLATPLHLHGNGEWEIRDGEGQVLQYGVWQVRDRTLIWSIKLDGELRHDPNPIVSVEAGSFELRERDGALTRFDRIGEP